MTDEEWNEYVRWEYSQSSYEFERTEMRHTTRRRKLTCGHEIDSREPYRYFVAKIPGDRTLVQLLHCDVCMREDNEY